ncbi:hypothetical protein Nizo2264_0500 [Lactiplantibacillus plantarum]|nr:hypothetical protein Nizo2264_0500 [Lactiplantibacillus plantarum]
MNPKFTFFQTVILGTKYFTNLANRFMITGEGSIQVTSGARHKKFMKAKTCKYLV